MDSDDFTPDEKRSYDLGFSRGFAIGTLFGIVAVCAVLIAMKEMLGHV